MKNVRKKNLQWGLATAFGCACLIGAAMYWSDQAARAQSSAKPAEPNPPPTPSTPPPPATAATPAPAPAAPAQPVLAKQKRTRLMLVLVQPGGQPSQGGCITKPVRGRELITR